MNFGLLAKLAFGVVLGWATLAQALPVTGLNGQTVVITESLTGAFVNDTHYPAPPVRIYNGTVNGDVEVHPGNGPASTMGYGLFAGVDINPFNNQIGFGIGGYCVGCGVTEENWLITFDFPNMTGEHFASVQHLNHNSAYAGASVVGFTAHSLTVDLSGTYVMYSCSSCYYKFFANFGYTIEADLPADTGGGNGGGAGGNAVPEPNTLALLGGGLLVLVAQQRRRASRKGCGGLPRHA